MIDGTGYERTYIDGIPSFELIPIEEEEFDKVGWTNLFHEIPKEQMKVLICMYLGLKPLETVEVLHFSSIGRYYNLSAALRDTYLLRKAQFID